MVVEREIQNYWIGLYLGNLSDPIMAAINRAYRDFNRTLVGISLSINDEKRIMLRETMKSTVVELIKHSFNDQDEFDNWHKKECDKIIESFKSNVPYAISYGQAQKWINMTLKYLFALGEERVKGISRNYAFFHIPIDRQVQKELEKLGIISINGPWSQINNYQVYIAYQKKLRNAFPESIPLDVEFKLFNSSKGFSG